MNSCRYNLRSGAELAHRKGIIILWSGVRVSPQLPTSQNHTINFVALKKRCQSFGFDPGPSVPRASTSDFCLRRPRGRTRLARPMRDRRPSVQRGTDEPYHLGAGVESCPPYFFEPWHRQDGARDAAAVRSLGATRTPGAPGIEWGSVSDVRPARRDTFLEAQGPNPCARRDDDGAGRHIPRRRPDFGARSVCFLARRSERRRRLMERDAVPGNGEKPRSVPRPTSREPVMNPARRLNFFLPSTHGAGNENPPPEDHPGAGAHVSRARSFRSGSG